MTTFLKIYETFWVKAPQSKFPPCQVWCPLVSRRGEVGMLVLEILRFLQVTAYVRLLSPWLCSIKHMPCHNITRNFRIRKHLLRKHFPPSAVNISRYWSHVSWVTIYETYVKNFFKYVQNHC